MTLYYPDITPTSYYVKDIPNLTVGLRRVGSKVQSLVSQASAVFTEPRDLPSHSAFPAVLIRVCDELILMGNPKP